MPAQLYGTFVKNGLTKTAYSLSEVVELLFTGWRQEGAPSVQRSPIITAWQPYTLYGVGALAVNPSGQIASANADFTSGAAYVAANWTVINDVGTGGGSAPDLTPAATERRWYVSTGTKASDSNDGLSWGKPFATIGAAVAARGAASGTVFLGRGTYTISAADTYGNGITQTTAGQYIVGQGPNGTTVNIDVNCTWAIQCRAQFCGVSQLLVAVLSPRTVTYGIGVDTATSSGSAQSCEFEGVYYAISTGATGTAGFALGPAWPGSGAVDIANTVFKRCSVASNGTLTHGFLAGNDTSANVLSNQAIHCHAQGAVGVAASLQYAVTCAGGGLSVDHLDTNSVQVANIHITHTAGEIMRFSHVRAEGGKRFLDVGYIGPVYGIVLEDIFVGGATPSDNLAISYNASGPLTVRDSYFGCGTATAISLFVSGAAAGSAPPLVIFDNVSLTNTTTGGWPAANPAAYLRRIVAASYVSSGVQTPNPLFQRVEDSDGSGNTALVKSVSYALAVSDRLVVMNGTSLTATLPDTALVPPGHLYTITNYNASALTVAFAASGSVVPTTANTLAQNASKTYYTIGSGLWIAI